MMTCPEHRRVVELFPIGPAVELRARTGPRNHEEFPVESTASCGCGTIESGPKICMILPPAIARRRASYVAHEDDLITDCTNPVNQAGPWKPPRSAPAWAPMPCPSTERQSGKRAADEREHQAPRGARSMG